MDLVTAILSCLTGTNDFTTTTTSSTSSPTLLTTEKQPLPIHNEDDLAQTLLDTLFTSDKSPSALKTHLHTLLSRHPTTTNLTTTLARRLLDGIVSALTKHQVLIGAMKETYDHVRVIAETYVQEHPVLVEVVVTVVAIGVLAVLMPWAVEALGFGELGPLEGSFAAWWQSTIPDVEAGSLFAHLQRLGMKWGKA